MLNCQMLEKSRSKNSLEPKYRLELKGALLLCMLLLGIASSAHAVDPAGAASSREMLAKFQEAFTKKDSAKFERLIYKQNTSTKAMASMLSVFKSDFTSGSATNARVITKATYDETLIKSGRKPKNGPVVRKGIAYDYPIPLSGYLMFDLKDKSGKKLLAASYPIGQTADSRMFFVARCAVVKNGTAD